MSNAFVPGADTQHEFRTALGRFATGVTIVSAKTDQGHIGMTANSFSSVSLDPPLILWCPAKDSERHDGFVSAKHFSIEILKEDQTDLSQTFAERGDAFDERWIENDKGVLILPESLCSIECETHRLHDAGDHTVVLGKVTQVRMRDGAPLIFAKSAYGKFQPSS